MPPVAPPTQGVGSAEDATAQAEAPAATYDDAQRAEQMYREGLRRYESKDLMGAIQVWRDAVRLAPENGEYNKRLGLALARNQRWHKEAEKHLLAAGRKDTLNAEITIALGNIYKDAGLKKRAEGQYRKVLAYSPGNKDAIKGLEELGIAYSFLSKGEAAKSGSAMRAGKKGDDEKQGVDLKIMVAVILVLLVLIYFYAKYMELI
jgi:tetratricopeptide (TPR) repeat protein